MKKSVLQPNFVVTLINVYHLTNGAMLNSIVRMVPMKRVAIDVMMDLNVKMANVSAKINVAIAFVTVMMAVMKKIAVSYFFHHM